MKLNTMPLVVACVVGAISLSCSPQLTLAQTETVVAPQEDAESIAIPDDINTAFRDPKMEVEQWVERFEGESREIYASRERILEALQLKPGMRVADVGAGTGFFSRLMARHLGDDGWVYAVDISPVFIKHISAVNREEQILNVTPILCAEDSVNLPRDSVDLVFVCDTYHHFEYPEKTLASIHRALRSDGHLVVIDFEREVGKSREWILQHVCAGRSEFTREILQAGFRLEGQVSITGFKENYLLRFQKVDKLPTGEAPATGITGDHDSQTSDP